MKSTIFFYIVIILSSSSFAYAYSDAEKRAFCSDYSRGYANSYETIKAYEYCYSNANFLIDRYENKKKENKEKDKAQWEQHRIANEKRKADEEKLKADEEKQMQIRLDSIKKNPFNGIDGVSK